ncbi:uncharacterized protein LOC133836014 [Drosophila sulfurigaster albostrigata]|uniref:uncharacterized protein LOC133836014 n=1 Tax=Drosophila sulfurigaster albostrigata TaxID=89887 RepID=UPI002D21D61B|nr:uncharacterized protein LOC133836014 [Drosophila sulfurigaster albostrigata]
MNYYRIEIIHKMQQQLIRQLKYHSKRIRNSNSLPSIVMNLRLKLFTVALPLLLSSGFNASTLKFTNVICQSLNKSLVRFEECRLRVFRRNMITFNLNATILHPVNVVYVNTQVLKKANGYKPFLMNITFDGCEYQRSRNNPYINLIYTLTKDVTNLFHKCPFYGTIFMKNLHVTPSMIKLPLPSGDYLLETNWMPFMRTQFITKFYFAFVED